MKIRTAARYRAKHRRIAPRTRARDRWKGYELGEGIKPDHAARAVDLDTCFPLGRLAGRPGHTGKERKTDPLSYPARLGIYLTQTGRREPTPKQERRLDRKHNRTLRPTA